MKIRNLIKPIITSVEEKDDRNMSILTEYVNTVDIFNNRDNFITAFAAYIMAEAGTICEDFKLPKKIITSSPDCNSEIIVYNTIDKTAKDVNSNDLYDLYYDKFIKFLETVIAGNNNQNVITAVTGNAIELLYGTVEMYCQKTRKYLFGDERKDVSSYLCCSDGIYNLATGAKVKIEYPFYTKLGFTGADVFKEMTSTFGEFINKINDEFLEVEPTDPDALAMDELVKEFLNMFNNNYWKFSKNSYNSKYYNKESLPHMEGTDIHKIFVDFVNAYFDAHFEEDDCDGDDEDDDDDSSDDFS